MSHISELSAEEQLKASPVIALLGAAYSLTHKMHAAADAARRARSCGQSQLAEEATRQGRDLRAQRDMIDAEIARRMGEQA